MIHLLPSTSLRPPLPPPLLPGRITTPHTQHFSTSPPIHPHLITSSSSSPSPQPPEHNPKSPHNLSPLFLRVAAVGAPPTSRTLKQWEERHPSITKPQLTSLARLLRRLGRHARALDIYEWMSSQPHRFPLLPSDLAALLDLISRARGLRHAEDFFSSLPEPSRDYHTHLALLHAYAHSKDSPKAHSFLKTMIENGYANHASPYNAVMRMHVLLREHHEVISLIKEMKERNVPLDETSFKILINSCQSARDAKGIAIVSRLLDSAGPRVSSSWSARALLSIAYSGMGSPERAAKHAEEAEIRVVGRDKGAFDSLIGAYSFAGRKDDVYRMWRRYRSSFPVVPDSGYYTMMSALGRLGDVDEAESVYKEWLSVSDSKRRDSRICNVFLACYAEERTASRAHCCLKEMEERGGTPHPSSWEVVALAYVAEKQTWEALKCLRNATYAEGPGAEKWMPKQETVKSFLYACAEVDDRESYEALHILLKILIRRNKKASGMLQLSREALGKMVQSVRARSEADAKRRGKRGVGG